jgi:hypothetical protein
MVYPDIGIRLDTGRNNHFHVPQCGWNLAERKSDPGVCTEYDSSCVQKKQRHRTGKEKGPCGELNGAEGAGFLLGVMTCSGIKYW